MKKISGALMYLLLAALLPAAAMGDVVIDGSDGFKAVTGVSGAECTRTKEALVFDDIRYDMQIFLSTPPISAFTVRSFEFRYRISGETTRPNARGELFYAGLGDRIKSGCRLDIPPLVRDGKWHVARISPNAAKDVNHWLGSGILSSFRFDPTNAEGGRLEISEIRFRMGASQNEAAGTVVRGKFQGEDAWPDLKPETFAKTDAKTPPVEAVEVEMRGVTATPRVQTAGGRVRLRCDYRGPVPKTAFLPVSIVIITPQGGVKWNERIHIPFAPSFRHLYDDVWGIEFDYELPLYATPGKSFICVQSPYMRCTSVRPPHARVDVKSVGTDPAWPRRLKAGITDVGGSPAFAVDGKPFYPMWVTTCYGRKPESARQSSAPVNLVSLWGDHLKWWPEGDRFDPTDVDRLAEKYRRAYPGAYFFVDIAIYPPPDWPGANPDDMARDGRGKVSWDGGDVKVNFSFASKKAYDDMERVLRKMIAHVESSPYANRVIGYRINSGHTNEWLGWDPPDKETVLDFSPVAQKGFEAFVRKHYPWVTDYSVPSLEERRALDADGGFLWNQRRHARAIAFHDFYNAAVADGAIRLCKAAKEASGGKLIGTYYAYVMTLANGGNGQMRGHFATKRLLDSGAADFIASPHSYSHHSSRLPGSQLLDMKPFRSIQDRGVVSVIEDDTRTHNIWPTGHWQTPTERLSVEILRRNMGVSLCRCQPFYTLALTSGHEFDFPRFADDAAALAKVGAHAVANRVGRRAEVAVVVSEEAIKSTPMYMGTDALEEYGDLGMQYYANTGKVLTLDRIRGTKNSFYPYTKFYTEISRIGAPVDYLLAEDLESCKRDYKFYVFQTCTKLTPSLRKAAELLRRKKCTILWTYAPGYTSDGGNSVANMKTLTGMDFALCHDVKDPGVTLEDGSKIGTLRYPKGARPLSPIFAAVNPDKVLGRYSNGAAGLAWSRTGKAKTVFSGSYFIEAPLLRKLALDAGVHLFGDAFDIFEANDRLLSFHARNSGRKTIRLPRKTTVLDVFGGRIVAKDTDSFEFDAPLHSSWLFYFADDAESLLENL